MAQKKKSTRSSKKGSGFAPFFLITLILMGGAFFLVRYFLLESEYFTVREIVVNKDEGLPFDEEEARLKQNYIGSNIFAVDISKAAAAIMRDLPHLRKAIVTRKFPDRLEVDVEARKAVAVMDAGRRVAIDRDGVVLSAIPRGETLPEIRGIKFLLNAPRPGDKLKIESLNTAVIMVDTLRKRDFAKRYKISFIDIAEKNNIVVGLEKISVKMGYDNFTEKINKLEQLLDDPKIKLTDISYIDLRFAKPVIAPK